MKPSIRLKLDLLVDRLDEIDRMLSAPDAAADMAQFTRLSRERAEIEPVIGRFNAFRQAERDLAEAESMRGDPEMREFADEEITAIQARLPELEVELQKLLLPRDPNDEKSVILEIRAGTGGDESALFAGDLFRMYSRYAERQRWQVEVHLGERIGSRRLSSEIICRIVGAGVYSRLKFESGGHRVQRVPETETQGRIHTSACTVAVMPEADEVDEVDLNPADLRVDTFRASGAGGQHINKTDSAVRITHIPTGIVAECQDGRSQHANRASAMRVLAARIRDIQVRAQQSHIASTRKRLIGSGDRSERIRTYNFPQGRITDHRINLTLYKIATIIEGDMDELLDALAAEHQADLLAELGRAAMTLFEALTAARQKIDRLDARLLLQHATGCSHSDLLARPETPVATAAGQQFMAWVERRAAGEPLAYLVGEAEFRGRVYQVSPAVLIPRPETEVLIDLALEKLRGLAAPRVLDLGTGSGIVAISLALECPAAQVVAVNLSPPAILVARNNASRLGADNRFPRRRLVRARRRRALRPGRRQPALRRGRRPPSRSGRPALRATPGADRRGCRWRRAGLHPRHRRRRPGSPRPRRLAAVRARPRPGAGEPELIDRSGIPTALNPPRPRRHRPGQRGFRPTGATSTCPKFRNASTPPSPATPSSST